MGTFCPRKAIPGEVLMAQSDEELYRQMRKGDQQAFAELYDRREPGLFRYAFYLSGSSVVAEEVAHDVFIELIGPEERFDSRRGSLEAYLYGVARNLVRVIQRRKSWNLEANHAATQDVIGDLIKGERSEALHAAIRELPDSYRDAVVLCDLEEKSYEEAAMLMNCALGTVRSRLHRARMLLAARLKPHMLPAGAREELI